MPSPSAARRYTPPPEPDFFVQAPVSVVRCRTLTPSEKTTYEVLLSYADAEGWARPGQARLAAEVGVSIPTVRAALRALAVAGLITPRRRGQGLTNIYQVHRVPLRGPSAERKHLSIKNEKPYLSKGQAVYTESDPIEQESDKQDQPPSREVEGQKAAGDGPFDWSERIATDVALIVEAVGMDPADATRVAQEAASQAQPPEYIAELVAHVTSSPSVQNPAGCLRALVRQGKRRPPRGQGGVPPRHARPTLHPEHYQAGGKYAHLFHPAPSGTDPANAPPTPVSRPSALPHSPLTARGPSAFAIQADPQLAGRGVAAWPRGQPLPGP